MRDRADMPIPVRVRNRLMITLSVTTLSCLMIADGAARATAQATPPVTPPVTADPQTPAAAAAGQDAAAAPQAPQDTVKSHTTLLVTVRGTDTGNVIGRAAIRLDSETSLGRSRGTDAGGSALFSNLDDGVYAVIVTAVGYKTTRVEKVNVVAGADTKLLVFLSPLGPTDINVNRAVDILNRNDYSISYTRDQRFIQDFPLNAGNRQDLSDILLSVPGVAKESENQFYTRGDGTVAMSMMIDGVLVPPIAQGNLGSPYDPNAFSSLRAIVGNFAPEYTGSGMVLDATTRPIPTRPTLSATARVGTDSTTEAYLDLGTSFYPKPFKESKAAAAAKVAAAKKAGQPPPKFGYILSLSSRTTNDSVEPAQGSNETVANYGENDQAFGKFDFQLKHDTTMDATVNYQRARTDIADRTGLPSNYALYGQGYGFAGAEPAGSLGSQADDNKADIQKDNNLLTILEFKRQLDNGAKVALSAASSRSTLEIDSNTPQQFSGSLPSNSSVEYLPYVRNDYTNVQVQGDITMPKNGFHQYKFGAVYQTLNGSEAYQLDPQSQVALDALHAIDPRLTATGGTVVAGAYDSYGYPVYSFPGGVVTGSTPVIAVRRSGYYAGAYAQDTWRVREALTVNYGLRFDAYNQSVADARFDTANGNEAYPGDVPSVSSSTISPRINGVLSFPQTGRLKFLNKQPTLARFGYNRLFSAPGMGQGAFIGNQSFEGAGGTQTGTPPQPEITSQYDVSIERQINTHTIGRIGYFTKTINHYLETEQLVPGLQADTLAVFNQGDVDSNGADISFEILPMKAGAAGKQGFHAFLSFESSQTHPTTSRDFNNYGYPNGATFPYSTSPNSYVGLLAPYIQGDQTNTLSFGVSTKAPNGVAIGLSGYYGSGLYSSAPTFYGLPVRDNSMRQAYSEINVFMSTGPRLFRGHATAKLEVANLLGSQERIDYFGAFDGTRFQQGRRVFLTLTGGF